MQRHNYFIEHNLKLSFFEFIRVLPPEIQHTSVYFNKNNTAPNKDMSYRIWELQKRISWYAIIMQLISFKEKGRESNELMTVTFSNNLTIKISPFPSEISKN